MLSGGEVQPSLVVSTDFFGIGVTYQQVRIKLQTPYLLWQLNRKFGLTHEIGSVSFPLSLCWSVRVQEELLSMVLGWSIEALYRSFRPCKPSFFLIFCLPRACVYQGFCFILFVFFYASDLLASIQLQVCDVWGKTEKSRNSSFYCYSSPGVLNLSVLFYPHFRVILCSLFLKGLQLLVILSRNTMINCAYSIYSIFWS